MRIENIDVQNVLGVRRIIMPIDTPVALFAGGNGAGKSSLCEAIRMALGENPDRVALKKEYGALVTEGKRKGEASVGLLVNRRSEVCGISFPDGKRHGPVELPAALPFVLDASRFARLDADARRSFLFELTGCRATSAVVKDLLLKRQCDEKKIDAVLPMLRNGFPAAADTAKDNARDSKAAWKAITGEAYGTQKADTWRAERPAYDADRLTAIGLELESLDSRIDAHAKSVGMLEEKHRAFNEWQEQNTARQRTAAKLPAAQEKLARDLAELTEWEQRVTALQARAGAEPRRGLIHDLARAVAYLLDYENPDPEVGDQEAQAALAAYEAQYGKVNAEGDPEAAAALPKAIEARDLMSRSVENDRRDIAAAQAAGEHTAAPEPVQVGDIDAVRTKLAELRALRKDLEAERQRQDTLATAASLADSKTEKAAAHHADVLAWLTLAEALSPDGIPGDLLSQALQPFNDRLRHSAAETGWMQVHISADMAITAAGRPYPLLSESEKWRADAMVAEAIAHLSGLKLLALDRMDVLEIKARGELLGWLDALALDGDLETGLVFGTLKALPTGLPETIGAHWIEAGEVTAEVMAEAA